MKEFICEFWINDRHYAIYNVDKIEGKKTYVGVTDYDTGEIFIENKDYNEMIRTLIHELMHVWLYENGYKDQNDRCLTFEQVCEYTAQSFNFIYKIVKRYENWNMTLHYKQLYLDN